MRQGKKILAVIPARGGSKGIPRKNIALVAGVPLIHYTTELLRELGWVDDAVVSTDDSAIAEEALRSGTAEIIWRPADLSGDRVGDMPVLAHALAEKESGRGFAYDVVVMLQPTSPLRTAVEVEECVDTLLGGNWDSAWTVSETDTSYHPEKQVQIASNGELSFFIESGKSVVARQELQPAYHRNGVAYTFSAEFVRDATSVFSPARSTAVVSSRPHISIDTPADLERVEKALKGRAGR